MSLRFDPFRESFREMDRLASQLRSGTTMPAPMPMDVWRSGDAYVVALDLPGIDANSLEVTLERGSLTVRAERRRAFGESESVLVAERPQGSFTRSLMLGDDLDHDSVEAAYVDGVLTLRIPVAPTAQPRRIEVRHEGTSPQAGRQVESSVDNGGISGGHSTGGPRPAASKPLADRDRVSI